jgi:hypothetical protein
MVAPMTPKARLSFSRDSATGVIGGFHQKKLASFVRFHGWRQSREKTVGLEIELAI